MKLEKAKRIGKEFLKKNNIDEREARLLLAFVLNVSSDELIRTSEITEDKFEEYQNVLNRRVQGTPFSYITGGTSHLQSSNTPKSVVRTQSLSQSESL